MQGRITVIRATDGERIVTDLTRAATLEELQKSVGGYIETVPYFDRYNGEPCVAFCNEEGKLDGLPLNVAATNAWQKLCGCTIDVLVGDVCILTGDAEFMEAI